MGKRDPRVDAYIAKSADFAQPILTHVRELVHAACPEVEETIKWSHPFFMHDGVLCAVSAFKQHCGFWLWKGALIVPGDSRPTTSAMGQFGRLTAVSDLPSKKILTGYIKQAMKLNESGVKSPARSKPKAKKAVVVPDDLASALKLKKNSKARATFDGFAPSHRREYVEWITEARREETRIRRLATTLEWLAEGKARNWKYENC